ncbi:cyclin-dependent kinase inhibitor 3-like [Alnus glutinosa]|uniref:cyclin-dependent kinase inhibitor 3-like n=1 Tax=Alnus glutinosa TaxID=3517 RepID=UPI002D79A11E|nr:cyclin-dependent kinase inhibitor 3-like [Alnus glutinosa]
MGKYMKKPKITGEVALLMELSHSIGVCTRAKALALQRLQKTTPSPAVAPSADASSSSSSYLQLRSRRLQKPPLLRKQQQQKPSECCRESLSGPRPNSRLDVGSVASSGSVKGKEEEEDEQGCVGEFWKGDEAEEGNDLGVEASFGENTLELDGRDRSTRESTPCSVRDSDSMGTPGSTTRRTTFTETNRRVRNDMRRNIPTAHEMEEFFVYAEKQQQGIFIEKYNFDFVNDLPLPGRYEWVQIIP